MNESLNQDGEFTQQVFTQLMEIFVTPAVRERQAKGELARPLPLRAAQIIFFPDERKPLVRVNEEVRARGQVRLKNGISKKAGDSVFATEIEGLEEIKLVEQDFRDCGHATLMKFNGNWSITFDFRYNKAISLQHLATAEQFYQVGQFALENGHWVAFVDNLFSACELAAKAALLATPAIELREKATHKGIHSRFNRFANLGNVKEVHKSTFNKLYSMRDKARYLKGEIMIKEEEARNMLAVVQELIQSTKQHTDDKES